jgi:hypothetical protein
VGAIQGSSERRSLNISKCLHPRNGSPCRSCMAGPDWCCRTCDL